MEDVSNNNKNNDSYNFLLLSLYFYLKKNNFNETSEKLFQECKLDSIFKFPQNLKSPKSDKEKLTNQFIEFFYSNSFKNDSNFDILSNFWDKFWVIFANKMKMGNNLNIETLFEKEKKNILKVSYAPKSLATNFIDNNNLLSFNDENLKTINNLTNINRNTNNNVNTEEMINIVNTSNDLNSNNMINNNYLNSDKKDKNLVNNNIKNNISNNEHLYYQNNDNNNFNRNSSNINKNSEKYNKSNMQIYKTQIYDEDDEEEDENDIEQEMDEFNGITFNNKNSSSIIKRPNGEEMPMGMYVNENDNEAGKLYQAFPPNGSSSNLNLNINNIMNENQNNMERNMSAIPLRKDVALENNNHDFDI